MTKKEKELTEAEVKDLKERANGVLAFTRQQILSKYPFIGNIAMSFDLIPVRDVRCPTACTDGTSVYFDIAFHSELKQEEKEFVLGHEIWHNVMLHFLRRDSRQPQLWNLATDMEVNQLLAKDGFTAPKDLIWPNNDRGKKGAFNFPSDLSAEEYYDLLLKEVKESQSNASGSGKPDDKDGHGGEGAQGDENGKSGKLTGQFDKHLDPNAKTEETEETVTDKYGKKGMDKDFNPKGSMSDSEKRQLTEKIREAAVGSAQMIERQRGILPGHVKKIVDALLTPSVPWREVLAAFVTKTIANRTDWNRPNRRFAYSGVYLPSHSGESLKIAVGVDTSGSCEEMFGKFITEVNSIAKCFTSYQLTLIQCDTQVNDCTTYDEMNPMDDSVASKIKFNGGGGTVLKPVFDHIELNDIDADAIVFFTDGYCETFHENDAPGVPVIWCIPTQEKNADLDEEFKNLAFGEKLAVSDK